MTAPMGQRIVFMGTPGFAVSALDSLMAVGWNVAAVYTQPPKPSGRGYHIQKSPVHHRADDLGIPVFTPPHFKDGGALQTLQNLKPDVIIVAAYGLLLPRGVLDIPPFGCLNIHASLLPRWRGASPIQRAIRAGDQVTGVTLMQMEEGLDTGPMIGTGVIPLDDHMTAPDLSDALARLGADLLIETLPSYLAGLITPCPQPTDGVTLAPKIRKEEGRLDWSQDARSLDRQMRALTPWPGCFWTHGDIDIKVGMAEVVPCDHGVQPGTVLDDRLTIACGVDGIRLLSVQKPGKGMMGAGAFLNGYPAIVPGTVLP